MKEERNEILRLVIDGKIYQHKKSSSRDQSTDNLNTLREIVRIKIVNSIKLIGKFLVQNQD